MDYEGKFRDFMVGWLAQQVEQPQTQREEIEALYHAVVEADSDREAMAEIRQALGAETAQQLGNLSDQWRDPAVEQAQAMLQALRQAVREDSRDASEFYLFFLNPFEKGCVPDGFEDRLEQEICWMFRSLYRVAGEAALAPKGWEPYVVVEPSYEDASNIIVLAYPREEFESKVFLCQHWYKAWNVRFASLPELAQQLLHLRHIIEQAETLPILGHHLTRMLTELIDKAARELNDQDRTLINDHYS